MNVNDILATARSCLGTPFSHQGRISGLALDCVGVLITIAQKYRLEYVDVQGYGRYPSNSLLEQALDRQPCLERVTAKQMGDVLLMRVGREPMHVAVLADETIIHAYESVGKVCEHLLTEQWVRRIVRVYRFKGLL